MSSCAVPSRRLPGEREEDYDEVRVYGRAALRPSRLFASDEDGTTAAKMPKVAADAIAERHQHFMSLQRATQQLKRWGELNSMSWSTSNDFDTFHCRHYGQASEVDNVIVRNAVLAVGDRACASPGAMASTRC